MKSLFFTIGLFFSFLLLMPQGEQEKEVLALETTKSHLVEKSNSSDVQKRFEQIGKDLKGCNCLLPRRYAQTTSFIPPIRVIKTALRFQQDIRLKEANQRQRVSEYNSLCLISYFSSLFCRNGEHVFALRKIII